MICQIFPSIEENEVGCIMDQRDNSAPARALWKCFGKMHDWVINDFFPVHLYREMRHWMRDSSWIHRRSEQIEFLRVSVTLFANEISDGERDKIDTPTGRVPHRICCTSIMVMPIVARVWPSVAVYLQKYMYSMLAALVDERAKGLRAQPWRMTQLPSPSWVLWDCRPRDMHAVARILHQPTINRSFTSIVTYLYRRTLP